MNQLKTIMCLAILASSLLSAAAGSGQEVRLRPGDTVRLDREGDDITVSLDHKTDEVSLSAKPSASSS